MFCNLNIRQNNVIIKIIIKANIYCKQITSKKWTYFDQLNSKNNTFVNSKSKITLKIMCNFINNVNNYTN